jgi:hypothetical protein
VDLTDNIRWVIPTSDLRASSAACISCSKLCQAVSYMESRVGSAAASALETEYEPETAKLLLKLSPLDDGQGPSPAFEAYRSRVHGKYT